MEIQARIPPALCALHNFIRHHDPSEIITFDTEEGSDSDEGDESNEHDKGEAQGEGKAHGEHGEHGDLSSSAVGPLERDRAGTKRDQIANDMWHQYQQFQQSHDHQEVEF
jgi:hypothetical protein